MYVFTSSIRAYNQRSPKTINLDPKEGNPAFRVPYELMVQFLKGEIGQEQFARAYVWRLMESVRNNPMEWAQLTKYEEITVISKGNHEEFSYRRIFAYFLGQYIRQRGLNFLYQGDLELWLVQQTRTAQETHDHNVVNNRAIAKQMLVAMM